MVLSSSLRHTKEGIYIIQNEFNKTQNWARNLQRSIDCVKNVRHKKQEKQLWPVKIITNEISSPNPYKLTVLSYIVYIYRTVQREISSFINTRCVILYIQFIKDSFRDQKLSEYIYVNIYICKYIYSKETLKHLMIFVVSEFIRKLQKQNINKKGKLKREINVENDRNICRLC